MGMMVSVTTHSATTVGPLDGDGAGAAPYDDPRITAMGLLVEAVAGLNARLIATFAEHGLSPAEFEALLRLGRSPGGALRMSDLAAQTQLTTSGITRVVDRLERDGLVERRACPTDRRGLFAHISEAGRSRLDAILPGHVELIERWLTGRLTPDQLDSFLTSLRIIRDGVRPEATAGARP
ncbi:MAG: MarR family transcriptional regulator, and catechol-resistance regulon repressor [Micromonosporaceae bacterium]|jgi:MarR family 2-MHQ and catechol resistance regulon transcriptional repressor|nr:MarR family transcriptional regulator, and catechol-resistance regulon repressor [Micromonosporaceae bacterium]